MSEIQKKTFVKPALSLDEQINLLLERGLVIKDEPRARHYLKYIGYYRLSGYSLIFQKSGSVAGPHAFKDGVTFDDILDCYIFDRELRLLVMDAIERIEVAVRTVISNTMSERHGPHWYMDKKLFVDQYNHEGLLSQIKKETNYQQEKRHHIEFIAHYYKNYHSPELPPSWMVAEVLSIGAWSVMFAQIKDREDQKEICKSFGIPYNVMGSWLHSLTYLRNLCAHHASLWNRRFTFTPKIMKTYATQLQNNATFYAQAVILHIFMDVIANGSHWQNRLAELLTKHEKIDIGRMGFPADWQKDRFWGLGQ